MARIGFWQMLLSNNISYWEANAINGAYDRAEIADSQAEANRFKLFSVEERMAQMSREIVMLRAAVTVLVNTLRDTNVLDPALLDARLEAALEEATAPPPRPTAAAGQPVEIRPITCIRCRTDVPPSSTVMSIDGPICDPCSAKM
jgi:hypothetical protein